MTDLKLVTSLPHKEEDILSQNPIRWKMGEIEMLSPLMTYREYMQFSRATRMMGMGNLMTDMRTIPEEMADELTMIKSISPDFEWWDEMGLPWLICKSSTPMDKALAFRVYNEWIEKHLTWGRIWKLTEQSSEAEICTAMTTYMTGTCYPVNIVQMLNQLLSAHYEIKKKVVQLLQRTTQTAKEEQQLSQSSRIMLESVRRKRLLQSRTSSS